MRLICIGVEDFFYGVLFDGSFTRYIEPITCRFCGDMRQWSIRGHGEPRYDSLCRPRKLKMKELRLVREFQEQL